MASSALYLLPPEQLSLLNSLLRNGDSGVREIARMTYETMGSVGHRRSQRAWEAMIYRWKEAKNHFKVVRKANMMADTYAVSDLVIKAIEEQLASEEPVSLSLLNAIRAVKGAAPQSLLQKLEAEVDAKIAAADTGTSNTLPRSPDRNYF